ncbi:cysteine desulfurase family protein [Cohnella cholangitidis]|uniref:Cysteine desulfurase n=1 Tax=Cohnella cholangitidis TaxID=2598458 RepID=A0A7G5BTX6_9BACL|nr:cysteine desulfurase family protein [Cohnella cholangitidis]QMV40410.1 cysteine desulfurase [Cohnella cholangitidis]
MKSYYYDHSASTPMLPIVIQTMGELMKLHYANPAALHRSGAEAMKLVDRARASIGERMGAEPEEVVFTSGGTESNNLAIKGSVNKAARTSKHIVTTAVEHASVYESFRQLETFGIETTILPVDGQGKVNPEDVVKAIRKDTVLVSVMQVNNETGVVQPIAEIGRRLSEYPHVRFHVDGVQAVGKVPFSWKKWGVDLYSGSAHKFGGPKGLGFLLVKKGIELAPLLSGGDQEQGIRSGTHNVPGIVAMSQALRLAEESKQSRRENMYAMRQRLLRIVADIPELVLNGVHSDEADAESRTAPHIVNLSYPGMRPEVIIHMLEKHGILVSTQSACSSKSLQPSRVLLAMGHASDRASGSIRISFGDEHAMEDIEILGERLKMVVAKLKPLERNSK